jgi:hypothetical protein
MRADVQRGLRTTTWRVAPLRSRWTTRRTGTTSPSRSPVSAGPGQAVADAVSRRRDGSWLPTDSRRPRRCRLRRSRAGRGAWPGGADTVCSWTSAVSAGQVSPFRVSARWCPPCPRCWQPPLPRISAKDRNVRVGPQSLSRHHTPSCLPPRANAAGSTNQTNRDFAGTLGVRRRTLRAA